MKKVVLILLIVAVTGCASLPPIDLSFLNTATVGPTDTPQPTVTRFPTSTPTPNLFALITSKPSQVPPTLGPGETAAPPTRTPTATITLRPTITLDPLDPSLFTPSPNIFPYVQRSTNQVVWGSTCDGARSIKFVVDVTPVRNLKYVLLFTRLQDKYSGRNTDWQTGAIMSDNDQGKYFYTLELDQIENYMYFEDAWLQYQFVASTVGLRVLGRSVVDRTSVSITHCSSFNLRY